MHMMEQLFDLDVFLGLMLCFDGCAQVFFIVYQALFFLRMPTPCVSNFEGESCCARIDCEVHTSAKLIVFGMGLLC